MPTTSTGAIAGLGITEMGKIYGRTATQFAAEAIALALDDAGLNKSDVDGLLINGNLCAEMNPNLQLALGFEDLTLLNVMNAYGSTPATMIQYAFTAVEQDQANVVVLVYADAPLQPATSAGASYATDKGVYGMGGILNAHGFYGANPGYAMATQRHMSMYGTTSEQLGAIAVAQRQWAMHNERAQIRKPLTLEEHQSSRYIAEPLHLFDCCLVSNGAVALVITSAEQSRSLRQPPVYVLGVGQAAPGDSQRTDRHPGTHTGAARSGEQARRRAGVSLADIDVLELYDCYTYTVLVSLEDYGFCEKGEGGPFVEDGRLGPGGSLPTNTGGGQLSSFYMWGFTPLSEGVIQVRGQGGLRQVDPHDVVLVSGNGGYLNYHSTIILSIHDS
jgi:acetyl-CoA acetyltransferase